MVNPQRVTGVGVTSCVSMELADLGILRWDADRGAIAAMFGDNFSFGWGQDWQSPSLVMYDKTFKVLGVPVTNGIAMQPRRQLWDYPHNNNEYSTVLPCDFIKIGQWWWVAAMVSAGLGNELRTVFRRSRDLVSWEDTGFAIQHPSHPGMVMLTFDVVGEYVYIFGTHGLRRDGPIWMWRCPATAFPVGRWEPRNNGQPIRRGRHGELCFRHIQGNAVLSFFDEGRYCQTLLTLPSPEGDWSQAKMLDYAWGDSTPQLYGGYISPTSRLNEPDGMKLWVSQWNTATNDPYRVLAFSATLPALGPIVDEPTATTEYHNPVASVLSEAMLGGLSPQRYDELAPAVAACLRDCGCTTVDRIAMWCAQVGHESGGLRYMQEIADGSAYEGRADLGNNQPGDGPRFKGHGPLQITGRYNHATCSEWAYRRGLVPTPTFFVDNPEQLASDRYGFIGVTWYWTTQRPMTEAADARDLERATRLINGGLNGLDDRRKRYENCQRMGTRLLDLIGAAKPVGERVLAFDPNIIPQETGYWCGPASAQIVLAIRKISVAEADLARECGTTEGGTDSVQLVERCLDARMPQANYTSVWMPNDPPTRDQKELLWRNLTQSIDAGYGLVMNFVAPPNNYPRGVKGSPNLAYGGGTVYHYVACVGYDDTPPRSVKIADPGFRPFQAWISFDQCATLIPPKGYIYANVTTQPAQPPTAPQRPPQAPKSTLSGRPRPHTEQQDPAGILLDVRAEQLITQALVFAIAEKMGIDAKAVYRKVKESFET